MLKDYSTGDILFINPKKTTQKTPFDFGLQQIDEGGVGRILSHGKNGFIIVSANRSNIYSTNKNCDLTQYYKQWCNENGQDYTNKKTQVEWLKNRNKNADLELKKDLKNRPFAYSAVYGGYHGTDDVVDSFEPSYIVYSQGKPTKRLSEDIAFDKLFAFAKELCLKYKQESVYVQAPGQSPNWVDRFGNKTNEKSSNKFKINRGEETFYTTTKRDKNNPQRFTADIVFENLYSSIGPSSYSDRIKRTQCGEIFLS